MGIGKNTDSIGGLEWRNLHLLADLPNRFDLKSFLLKKFRETDIGMELSQNTLAGRTFQAGTSGRFTEQKLGHSKREINELLTLTPMENERWVELPAGKIATTGTKLGDELERCSKP